jgi:hypothetical protein
MAVLRLQLVAAVEGPLLGPGQAGDDPLVQDPFGAEARGEAETAVWVLITQRSQVQILPPLQENSRSDPLLMEGGLLLCAVRAPSGAQLTVGGFRAESRRGDLRSRWDTWDETWAAR